MSGELIQGDFQKEGTPLPAPPPYVELATTSNFTFLKGSSHPNEYVLAAQARGHAGVGIADRNTLAGVVRAHEQAKAMGFPLAVGARLAFCDGTPDILAYPTDRAAYGRLCRLLTAGNMRAEKGDCLLSLPDLLEWQDGLCLAVLPPRRLGEGFSKLLDRLKEAAGDRLWLAAAMPHGGDDGRRLARLAEAARRARLPLLAVGDVLYHHPDRRPLHDVLTCIRAHVTLDQAGRLLEANAERHLKGAAEMARLFRAAPEAVAETMAFFSRLKFSLDHLEPTYPREARDGYASPQDALHAKAWAGAAERYPEGIPPKIRSALIHELAIIGELGYAPYFLTVDEIVRFARDKEILCQGRGSAANSTVCYCLGLTEVNPMKSSLLFERFISRNRKEPPDIDVDFEHGRRGEVLQFVYDRYGAAHAGLAATTITYRTRSAVREVGKVFGLSDDTVGALAGSVWGWSSGGIKAEEARRLGLDPSDKRLAMTLTLTKAMMEFPRHLSQHVGGMVVTHDRLDETVPLTRSAMDARPIIEWNKDDLEAVGLLKVDVLALGMLTAIKKCYGLLEAHYGDKYGKISHVEQEDDRIYAMLQRADSIGVFQVESRAQQTMLPRLRPACMDDIVVEVAIVRPGPIQGGMVHPYLRRKQGIEPVVYPSAELKEVLEGTLGVPLFQEQAMQIAIVAAGFSPEEADKLRRSMATFKNIGTIGTFRDKLINGMIAKKYDRSFAEKIWEQIKGFGSYGFPRSHAESFALLVYCSAWIKCHYPDVFLAGMLNAWPMGFYQPAQLVRDAQEHGVEVRPVDVNASCWDHTLEEEEASLPALPDFSTALTPSPTLPSPSPAQPSPSPLAGEGWGGGYGAAWTTAAGTSGGIPPTPPSPSRGEGKTEGSAFPPARTRVHPRHAEMTGDIRTTHALRLGLRQVDGFREDEAKLIAQRRGAGYDSVRDLWLRTGLPPSSLERLADADAFRSLGLDRRAALWAVRGLRRSGDKDDLPLFRAASSAREPDVDLPILPPGAQVIADYRHLKLSLKDHPVAFLRHTLEKRGVTPANRLPELRTGRRLMLSGLVLVRQRPGTASGVIFMTIEDEDAWANIIVWPRVFETFRPQVMGARLVGVTGRLQNESKVIHLVAEHIEDWSHLLEDVGADGSRIDPILRTDAVRHGGPDQEDEGPGGRKRLPLPALTEATHPPSARSAVHKGRNFH
ncbi:error-prone DNA polymerase [Aquabacter sp. CN5-332]|uniref:error-prone DNA polymerase n=1 Tax=Aquabacter sp. CN5-332 TaxID=3156608 RepID=UPI0032B33802